MEKKNILDMLKEHDSEGYGAFLNSKDISQVADNDEVEFFRRAPEEWQLAYLKRMWPKPKSERCLMESGSPELLQLSYRNWGFFEENIVWALEFTPLWKSRIILSYLEDNPGEDAEHAMLCRKDVDLLRMWVNKFRSLSDAGEQFLEDNTEMQFLKSEYINLVLAQ